MKTILALTLLTLTHAATAAPCSWNNPGTNPYRGGDIRKSVAEALARYPDIPPADAEVLFNKIRRLEADAVVSITRDGMHSNGGEVTNLRDMHYGRAKVCLGPVQRDKWTDNHQETALVYCSRSAGLYCVAVPVVCGNIARVDFWPYAFTSPSKPKPPTFNHVPEPGTAALLALGLIIMAATRSKHHVLT